MAKSADAFRTISEVAEWLDTPTHVLRFWESKFTQVKPVKRAGGRRYYRRTDMELLGGIKKLLHDDGLTIKGVQKILREQGVKRVTSLSPSVDGDHNEAGLDDASNDILHAEIEVPLGTETADVLQFSRAETDEPQASEPKEKPNANVASSSDEPAVDAVSQTDDEVGDSNAPAAETQDVAATGDDESQAAFEQDPSQIPAFLHRASAPVENDPEPVPSAPEASIAETPKPRKIETEPDPSDTEMDATAGLLTRIFDKKLSIDGETAARISPLLDRLSALNKHMRQTTKD